MDTYYKYTNGHVSQCFEWQNGRWVIVGQKFVAGNPVEYEDDLGNPISVPDIESMGPEPYEPYHMIQPTVVWFILCLHGCIDPELFGPYDEETANKEMEKLAENPKNSENSYTLLGVPNGVEIKL